MAFVVETGAVVADANSYLTVEEADAFLELRESPEWDAADQATKEGWLIEGTQEIDVLMGPQWKGYIVSTSQALLWPRQSVLDDLRKVYLGCDEIPTRLKRGVAILAWWQSRFPTVSGSASSVAGASSGGPPKVKSKTESLEGLVESFTYQDGGISIASSAEDAGYLALAKDELKKVLFGLYEHGQYAERG